jgi:hypothetical protein
MSGLERKEQSKDPALANVLALLSYYFELGDEMPEQLVAQWLEFYPAPWIRLATIEALYRGRYKAVSVTQILEVWQRRSQVLKHFSYDFELLVCGNLPDALLDRDFEPAEEELPPSELPLATPATPDISAFELEAVDTPLDTLPVSAVTSSSISSGSVTSGSVTSGSVTSGSVTSGSVGGDLPPSAIHQFTPITDRSDFYTRLKSIAEHSRDPSVPPVEDNDTKVRSED